MRGHDVHDSRLITVLFTTFVKQYEDLVDSMRAGFESLLCCVISHMLLILSALASHLKNTRIIVTYWIGLFCILNTLSKCLWHCLGQWSGLHHELWPRCPNQKGEHVGDHSNKHWEDRRDILEKENLLAFLKLFHWGCLFFILPLNEQSLDHL